MFSQKKSKDTEPTKPTIKRATSTKLRIFFLLLVVVAIFVVAVKLKPTEEVAEAHYQSALTLLAEGDEERATIEFKNVFKNNEYHKEARRAYAELLLKNEDTPGGYQQLLTLSEQYPRDILVRQRLAEIAFESDLLANVDLWKQVTHHVSVLNELAPNDPKTHSLNSLIAYRDAIEADQKFPENNGAERRKAIKKVDELLAENPDDNILLLIKLDDLMLSGIHNQALISVDNLIEKTPNSLRLAIARLNILISLDDQEGVRKQLYRIYEIEPQNRATHAAIVNWHTSNDDIEGGEAFLRNLADESDTSIDQYLELLRYIDMFKGRDAAITETNKLIADSENTKGADESVITFKGIRANYLYLIGEQEEALAELESIIENADESSNALRGVKVLYARFLDQQGNREKASAQIEEVLKEDKSHIRALNLRALWKMAADRPSEAVIDLRTALNQNPQDIQTINILAQAHQLEGAPELAGERLALAYQLSGFAPEESLAYASFLISQNDFKNAESVLLNAQRLFPENIPVLATLGLVYSRLEEWKQLDALAQRVKNIGTPEAINLASGMSVTVAVNLGDYEAGIDYAEQAVIDSNLSLENVVILTQLYTDKGRFDDAKALIRKALEEKPDNLQFKVLWASLLMQTQDEGAEEFLTELVQNYPNDPSPHEALYLFLASQGRHQDAENILNNALLNNPTSFRLNWIKAGLQQERDDIEGAIATYQALHDTNIEDGIVSNNLASLLSTYRDDKASIDQAYNIIRNLNGSPSPYLKSTFGWVQLRRGNFESAITPLQLAASELSGDVLPQVQLAVAYAALGQIKQAQLVIQKAQKLVDKNPEAVKIYEKNLLVRLSAAIENLKDGTPFVLDGIVVSQ